MYKVQLKALEHYLLRKVIIPYKYENLITNITLGINSDAGESPTAITGKLPMKKLIMTVIIDTAISYSWLTSLIIVCTTTLVLLLIVGYKRIMEKLSSNANKVDQCIKVSSETVSMRLKYILLGY